MPSDTPGCPRCGAGLSASAPEGLCAACLLTQVLSDDDVDLADEAGGAKIVPGTTLGAFRINGLLGKGGMASVYEAYDAPLDRVVALKVLPQEFLHDDSFAKRFQREARVVASLEHAHIVPIYANGIEDGVPWMSMRLVAGGSLADLIKRGRPGPSRCSRILQGIAAALDHAHAHGVVHRDIKPSNVLLDESDHAWVCDFGLAQLMQQSLALTRTGVVIGTPRYMSPEQVLGQEIGITSDVYSLGIVAYEMLTGAVPFDADSPVALLMKHVNERMPTPAGGAIPGTALTVLKKALAKSPTDRYQSAGAFVAALDASLVATQPARTQWSVAIAGSVAAVAAGIWLLRPGPLVVPQAAVPTAVTAPVRGTASPAATTATPAPPVRDGRVAAPAPALPRRAADARAQAPSPDDLRATPTRPATVGDTLPVESPTANRTETSPPPATVSAANPTTVQPPPRIADAVPQSPPPTEAPRPSNAVTQPVRTVMTSPVYPQVARAAQLQGDVLLEAVVGPDGNVSAADVVRSVHPVLDEAARRAVLQYKYKPGLRNGAPDTFRVRVIVSFRLQ